jgi:hypothetical protein
MHTTEYKMTFRPSVITFNNHYVFPQRRSDKRNLTVIDTHLRDEMSDMLEHQKIKIPAEMKFLPPNQSD